MKIKKTQKIILLSAIIVIFLVCIAPTYMIGRRPFKDLQATDIKTAKVCLIAPMEEIRIDDLESFVDCLQDTVIYQEKKFYDVPDGGEAALYIVEMKDGTERRISLNNSHLVMDGIRYRTNKKTFEKLKSYGYEVRDARNNLSIEERLRKGEVLTWSWEEALEMESLEVDLNWDGEAEMLRFEKVKCEPEATQEYHYIMYVNEEMVSYSARNRAYGKVNPPTYVVLTSFDGEKICIGIVRDKNLKMYTDIYGFDYGSLYEVAALPFDFSSAEYRYVADTMRYYLVTTDVLGNAIAEVGIGMEGQKICLSDSWSCKDTGYDVQIMDELILHIEKDENSDAFTVGEQWMRIKSVYKFRDKGAELWVELENEAGESGWLRFSQDNMLLDQDGMLFNYLRRKSE